MSSKNVFFVLIIIFFLFSCHALAYELDDIEWSDTKLTGKTLHWGGTLTAGEYTVKAEDFDEGGLVSIAIYRDGVLKDRSPVKSGFGFEYRDTEKGDDIRIFVKSMDLNIDEWTGNMEDPTAAVEVYERGEPEMDITIKPESDEYDPRSVSYKFIEATISIKNEGDAQACNMDVDIDVDGMKVADGKLNCSYSSVDEDEVLDSIDIKLEIPHYWKETDVDINVTTKSEDINGDIIENTETETITVLPAAELIITKTVADEIYIDQTAHVSVNIWNKGIYDINSVIVSDEETGNFEVQGSVGNNITLSFSPDETKSQVFEYSLKPVKTGKFTIPSTTATFTDPDGQTHTFTSDESTIEVNGPDINVTKTVSPESISPGDSATVKVTVKNQGNRDASVVTKETIPQGATYVSGDLTFDDVIAKRKSYSYSYVIRADDIGELELPETTASFIDMEDYKGEKISNKPVLTVIDPDEAEKMPSFQDNSAGTDMNSPDNLTYNGSDYRKTIPGFEAGFAALALFAVLIIYRYADRQ